MNADIVGTPLPDPSRGRGFDVVLCAVLEHVDDPAAVVRELSRVTGPGGRVLASTHGVMLYHPAGSLALDARAWRLFEGAAAGRRSP